jgi:hypothetical protein
MRVGAPIPVAVIVIAYVPGYANFRFPPLGVFDMKELTPITLEKF